jgi:ABC-type Fe3+ transport system substrate-binding protein
MHPRCLAPASLPFPHFASYPEEAKEKTDKGLHFWAIARESCIGFAYNTKLLSKSAVPKNYEGLLHPELKGRTGLSISDPSYKVIGAVIRTRGEELVSKLKVQEITHHSIIPLALLDLIASGEVLASPAIFRNHTLNAIAKGAPVDRVPMDIVPTNVGSAAIAAQPPHPHAPCSWRIFFSGGKVKRFWKNMNTAARRRTSASIAGARSMVRQRTSTRRIF